MLGAVLAAAILLGACTGNAAPAAVPPAEGSAPEAEAASFQVTDGYGREVEVPAEVRTVAVIGSAARIITYAGCADLLTGVTDMDKTPAAAMPYSVVNAERLQTSRRWGAAAATTPPISKKWSR
jgi:iron complex transport system substrate-binding protein